jgi:hypothetical protein
MSIDQSRNWLADWHFRDRNGASVKAYDDVLLHVDAPSVSPGSVAVESIRAGTVGTVIFVTEDEPVWLSLECDVEGGMAFAENVPATEVTLHRTAEEKWPNAAN